MRVGLFGGSFDPIHFGHIEPVRAARRELALDRVIYLPTGRPPHKPDRRMAPALSRLVMTELALLDDPDLHVSAHELTEERAHYTVDTVRHFRATRPDDDLILLIGADSFEELELFREWEVIVRNATVGVLDRPGCDAASIAAARPALQALLDSGGASVVRNVPVDVSSTEVRSLLAAGERPDARLVPAAVVDFALKYDLYR
jgi:nicotinate-nucleotide adenylyltransferase